jgi:hypothetical protein
MDRQECLSYYNESVPFAVQRADARSILTTKLYERLCAPIPEHIQVEIVERMRRWATAGLSVRSFGWLAEVNG